jgi:hypothetical protein
VPGGSMGGHSALRTSAPYSLRSSLMS